MDTTAPSAQSATVTPPPPQQLQSAPSAQLSDSVPPSQDISESSPRVAPLTILNNAEKYWTWKAALRVVICVLNVVAIGCLGWIMSGSLSLGRLDDYSYVGIGGWDGGAMATFCISFAWCFFAILIPFVLKPSRPLHPGIAVGIDLVFWLGFLVIGLFTLAAVYDIALYGTGGYIEDPNYSGNSGYSGEYYLAPNNTWIYNVTDVNNSGYNYNYTSGEYEYTDTNITDVVRDCTPLFATCQEQDQYINDLWHEKPRREATTIIVNAVEWLNLLLHFTLFVWACVDTHRFNARGNVRKEQIIADRIIADLESKGLISVNNGVVQPPRTGQPEMVQGPPGPSGTR